MPPDTLTPTSGNYAWDYAGNWSAGVPTASSDVVITAPAGQDTTVTIAAGDPAYTVASLTYDGTAGTTFASLNDSGSLTVTGATSVTSGALNVLDGAALSLQDLTLGGGGFIQVYGVAAGSLTVGTLNGVGSNGIVVTSGTVSIATAAGASSLGVDGGGSLGIGTTSGTDLIDLFGGHLSLGLTGTALDDDLLPSTATPVDLLHVAHQPGEIASVSLVSDNDGEPVFKIVLTSASGQALFTFNNVLSNDTTYGPVPPTVSVGDDGTGGTLVTIACYTADTAILTPDGEVRAGSLCAGDPVVTASGRVAPIVWVGRRSYAGRFLAGQRHLLPIRIRAGALADGVPHRDLLVSPCHAMLIGGALIPASELVNGRSIVQESRLDRVDYVHIELAQHDVILAEGAPSETFVDDCGRGAFHNAADWRAAHPHAEPADPVYCAPRLTEGAALEAVRRSLMARSGCAELAA